MLAYRCTGGYALVAGDPIGPPEASDRLLREFLEHCRTHGRRVAFLGAREDDLPLYRRHGLCATYLGDEAVVHCDTFTVAHKSVRAAVTRVGRECTFRLLRETDAPAALREALEELRERWRDGEDERGFTMELGGGVRGEDAELLLAVAFADDGRPLGFLRLVPCYGAAPGWSLDLMQHDPDAPNGMTEYLIAMTAQELRARGDKRLSLNFATWGRLFAPDAELTFAQRAQRRLAIVLSPYFQIRSLRDFNAKFDPEWVPRSIVVQDPEDLPWVGLLYASVEGFLRLPRFKR
jgi:lysyl-tRNA synthetase, class II